MKTLARFFALVFAATLFAAPLPAPAQQKQDTMDKKDKKEQPKKKLFNKKKRSFKEATKQVTKKGDAKNAPAPGPK